MSSLTEDVAISPCKLGDCIHRKNVVSKSYVMPEDRMQQAIEDFISSIAGAGLETDAWPFFIMEPMENKWIKIKVYISIEHSNPKLPKGLHFDSYFSVDNMVSLCIAKDPEKYMSDAYVQLYSYLQENSLRPITPIIQVLGGNKHRQYTFLKVGYSQS